MIYWANRGISRGWLIGIGVLIAFLIICVRGPQLWLEMWAGDFDDPDTFYVLDIIWSMRHGHPFGLIPRVVEDGGAWIHWSRLYPFLVDGLSRLYGWCGMSDIHALYVSVVTWSIVPWIALVVFLPLVMGRSRMSLMAACVYWSVCANCVAWQLYGSPTRGTHHMLMMAIMCFMFVGVYRTWRAEVVGVLAAIGIWVSPEVFPLVLLALAMEIQESGMERVRRMVAVLSWSLIGMVMLDPPAAKYGVWAPDHVSWAYVALFILEWVSIGIMAVYTPTWSWWRRCAGLVLPLCLWICVIPGLHHGVHGIIPDDLYASWYLHVGELKPSYTWPECLLYAVGNIVAFLIGTMFLYRSTDRRDWVLWLGASVYIGMSLLHTRTVLPSMVLTSMVVLRGISASALHGRIAAVSCLLVMVFGLCLEVLVYPAVHPRLSASEQYNCFVDQAAPELIRRIPDHAGVISEIDMVPAVLWWTRDSAFRMTAGPYHRDHAAMRLYYAVSHTLVDPDFHAAHALMLRHDMRYILYCPHTMLGNMQAFHQNNGLFMQLLLGHTPSWLHTVDMGGNLAVLSTDAHGVP